MAPTEIILFRPVMPDDDSAVNIHAAHVNLSNLWTFAAILFREAGCYDNYIHARQQAIIHGMTANVYHEIAVLAWLNRQINPQLSGGC